MISKEHKSIYDKKRYRSSDERRTKFVGKKCPSCEILLIANYGAYKTRRFCRGCRDNGSYKRILNREHYEKKTSNRCNQMEVQNRQGTAL